MRFSLFFLTSVTLLWFQLTSVLGLLRKNTDFDCLHEVTCCRAHLWDSSNFLLPGPIKTQVLNSVGATGATSHIYHLPPAALGLSSLNPWQLPDTCQGVFKLPGELMKHRPYWSSDLNYGLPTNKAVDEAKRKANRADGRWEDLMIGVNLQGTYVHLSEASAWLFSNAERGQRHLDGSILLLLHCCLHANPLYSLKVANWMWCSGKEEIPEWRACFKWFPVVHLQKEKRWTNIHLLPVCSFRHDITKPSDCTSVTHQYQRIILNGIIVPNNTLAVIEVSISEDVAPANEQTSVQEAEEEAEDPLWDSWFFCSSTGYRWGNDLVVRFHRHVMRLLTNRTTMIYSNRWNQQHLRVEMLAFR